MKIAYIDISTMAPECYALNSHRYGGGGLPARYLKQMDGFHLYAPKVCFDSLGEDDRKENCFEISDDQKWRMMQGYPLKDILVNIGNYDIILHNHCDFYLNTEGLNIKQAAWVTGHNQYIHPLLKNIFLYNKYQKPQITNKDVNIYDIILGKEIPSYFKERKKDDYIFQCTRHCLDFNSVHIANFCKRNGIRGIFAGPVVPGYNLLDYIDGKNVIYVGEVDEETKLKYTENARLYTLLINDPVAFNLSAIEALSLGTPVAAMSTGFFPSLIKHGENGFLVGDDRTLKEAWDNAPNISQSDCYSSILQFNQTNMVDKFLKSCKNVVDGS